MDCVACGEPGPTKAAEFRQVTGMVVVSRVTTASGEFCDPCARTIGRKFTLSTLVGGWWGFKSFATTLFTIPANLAEVRRLRRTPPTPASPTGADLDRSEGWQAAAVLHRRSVFWWVAASLTIPLAVALAIGVLAGGGDAAANVKIAAVVVGPLLGIPSLVFVGLALARRSAANRIAAKTEAAYAGRVRAR